MSADRWSICPRCHKNRKIEPKLEYGKAPEKEYLESLNKKPEPEEEAMREDWDIGIYDNKHFEVSYRAHCETCGFNYEFEKKELLNLD